MGPTAMHVGNDVGTDTDGAADAVAVDVATVMARARGTITAATRFFIVSSRAATADAT